MIIYASSEYLEVGLLGVIGSRHRGSGERVGQKEWCALLIGDFDVVSL